MNDPQNALRVIHIAGTNGKGSVGAMLSSILTCAGYRTGHFSSPALIDETDALRICGESVAREDLTRTLDEVLPLRDAMPDRPTDFEVFTAAALLLFARAGCDPVIVECGMGGDGDATNVFAAPLLSVITNVQKDHTAFLGDTLARIAEHKAGIIKRCRPVLFGGDDPDALAVIRTRAAALSSPLYFPEREKLSDVRLSPTGTDLCYDGTPFYLSAAGAYQVQNALTVLAAIPLLRKQGLIVPDEAVKRGLASVRWRGRMELLRSDPPVIYDGAHNPDGFRALEETLCAYFGDGKVVLLTAMMADKECDACAEIMSKRAESVFTVAPEQPRAADPEALADLYRARGVPAKAFSVLRDGVAKAYDHAEKSRLPLIAAGSLYSPYTSINL